MIRCVAITAENLPLLEVIYPEFQQNAQEEYQWLYRPLDYEQLCIILSECELFGYLLIDTTSTDIPLGFMLYRIEPHRAIEVNIFYVRDPAMVKIALDRLMRKFIQDIRKRDDWDVVSWALLGRQMEFVRTITWYGFKPVGQAIVKFEFTDSLSLEILRKQKVNIGPLQEPYRLTAWQDIYQDSAAEIIYKAFHKASDAFWDPRFRTMKGAAEVIRLITSGTIGDFMPEGTAVLLRNGLPIGFCFLLQSQITQVNIPLIGIHPDEKGQGLSKHLLKFTLNKCLEMLMAGTHAILSVNATLDTDNAPAILMYRRLGFRDDYNYGHVYLPREKAETMIVGQWCQSR